MSEPTIKPIRRCPECGQPATAAYKPFCTSRCADIDLGRWLTDGYAIPGGAIPDDSDDDTPERTPDSLN